MNTNRLGVSAPLQSSEIQTPRQWVLAAALFGLLVVAGIRQGGFWPATALVVAVVSLLMLGLAMVLVRPDRQSLCLVAAIVGLALWWLVRDLTVDPPGGFLPLGASMLGFAAAFVAVRPLTGRTRELAGVALALLGAAGALVGFAGLVWRWYPMAMPAQGLWRLSSSLTYADAAGLGLAVCLLVALGLDRCPPLIRVAVCLCAGGLLATQSRGAFVAFACGCVLVPWRRYLRFAVPLAAGIALGVAAIASSPRPTAVPWLAAVLVATAAASALCAWDIGSPNTSARIRVTAIIVAAVGVAAAIVALQHEVHLRALAPSDQDRTNEWSAAFHQWTSAPLLGVGPDRLLTFHASDGTLAHFAHNEFLQIAAGAGILGLGLLALSGFLATRVARRFDLLSSCSVAALVCWTVAGGFDFDWHLTFVGLLGGSCLGLAAGRDAEI